MATEVNFYHLTRSSLEAALPRLLAKTLLIEYEPSGRITVILVPETLGF